MRKLLVISLLVSLMFIQGCASMGIRTNVLTDDEVYFLIPAGTPFKAVLIKGGPLEDVVRTSDSYNVEAGYLLKLQKEANARALTPR